MPEDAGVERLLRLLWCFRHRNRTRTNVDIEACGYPDMLADGWTGRRNFFNDRERLTALGVSLEPLSDHSGWRVTGQPDDVTLQLARLATRYGQVVPSIGAGKFTSGIAMSSL